MSLAVDWLGTVQSIYYQPFNRSYRNGWQVRKCVLCMTVIIEPLKQIIRVDALFLSVSFKPIFVLFDLVLYMPALPSGFIAIVACVFLYFFDTLN